MSNTSPKLSIVASLFMSAPYIEEFCRRAAAEARRLVGEDFEIVLVNDGSPDNSIDLAIDQTRGTSHVRVVDLSRNFGHHKAMMTGLAHARGERIFLLDSDLEEEPEWLPAFAKQMDDLGCDVVYGVQENRRGGSFERWSGKWFYVLFKASTGLSLPENIVTARLMTRRYVDALLRHDEREVFIAGLWYLTGFEQVPFVVNKHASSQTTYTLRRKMSLLVNSITAFSNRPLIAVFYCGVCILAVAVAYISYLVFHWTMTRAPVSGWTSVMASIWLLGGLIISFIGIVGIYLSKIYSEAKRRPYTIVRRVYGGTDD